MIPFKIITTSILLFLTITDGLAKNLPVQITNAQALIRMKRTLTEAQQAMIPKLLTMDQMLVANRDNSQEDALLAKLTPPCRTLALDTKQYNDRTSSKASQQEIQRNQQQVIDEYFDKDGKPKTSAQNESLEVFYCRYWTDYLTRVYNPNLCHLEPECPKQDRILMLDGQFIVGKYYDLMGAYKDECKKQFDASKSTEATFGCSNNNQINQMMMNLNSNSNPKATTNFVYPPYNPNAPPRRLVEVVLIKPDKKKKQKGALKSGMNHPNHIWHLAMVGVCIVGGIVIIALIIRLGLAGFNRNRGDSTTNSPKRSKTKISNRRSSSSRSSSTPKLSPKHNKQESPSKHSSSAKKDGKSLSPKPSTTRGGKDTSSSSKVTTSPKANTSSASATTITATGHGQHAPSPPPKAP